MSWERERLPLLNWRKLTSLTLRFDGRTGKRYACKVVSKKIIGKSALKDSRLEKQHLEQEIDILFQISHPNIVKVNDVVQTEEFVYIFLDRILGGNFIRI
jgi:serine/threonine protein kinase